MTYLKVKKLRRNFTETEYPEKEEKEGGRGM